MMAENTQSTKQDTVAFQESGIELLPVRELLGKKFFIPSYQRGYRWTKQQVKALLDDINDFEPQRKSDGELTWYCLQPVLVVTETKFQHSFLVGNSWGRCPQTPGVFQGIAQTGIDRSAERPAVLPADTVNAVLRHHYPWTVALQQCRLPFRNALLK